MHDQTFSVSRRTLLRAGAVLSLGLLASCGTPKITPSGNGSDQTDATLGYINDLRKQRA